VLPGQPARGFRRRAGRFVTIGTQPIRTYQEETRPMRYRSLGNSGLVVSVAGLGVLPYFPLANGLLSGKVRRGVPPPEGSRLAGRRDYITDRKIDQVERLIGWAQQHGVTILDVAVGGLAAQPGCSSVIAGATSPEQVKANAAAASWVPSAEELAGLDRVVPGPAASA
jgi:aryl-alcohol dehydrogenase-like predicted oxidoreductase